MKLLILHFNYFKILIKNKIKEVHILKINNNILSQNLKGFLGENNIKKQNAGELNKDGYVPSSTEEKPDFMKIKENVKSSQPEEVKEKNGFNKPLVMAGAGIGAACFLGGLLIPGGAMLMPVGVALGGGLIYAARPKGEEPEEVKLPSSPPKKEAEMVKPSIHDAPQVKEPLTPEEVKLMETAETLRKKETLTPEGIKLVAEAGYIATLHCNRSEIAETGKAYLKDIAKSADKETKPLFICMKQTLSQEDASNAAKNSFTQAALKSLGDGKTGLLLLTDTAVNGMEQCWKADPELAQEPYFWGDKGIITDVFYDEAQKLLPRNSKSLGEDISRTMSTYARGGQSEFTLKFGALKSLNEGKSGFELLKDTVLFCADSDVHAQNVLTITECFMGDLQRKAPSDEKSALYKLEKDLSYFDRLNSDERVKTKVKEALSGFDF